MVGGMAVQWLLLLPHKTRDPGLTPASYDCVQTPHTLSQCLHEFLPGHDPGLMGSSATEKSIDSSDYGAIN